MKQKHNFGKGKSKLNHLFVMDDLKMYGGSQSYIDTLNRLYNVTDDIDMGFRIDKCGLAMHRGKESECEGITVGSGDVIGEIHGDSYKYLSIMERSDICQE